MPNTVAALGAAVQAVPAQTTGLSLADKRQQQVEHAEDYRLVIEEGPRRGSFVYKTIDRTTGELIRQYPREALVKMTQDASYKSGTVANTKA